MSIRRGLMYRLGGSFLVLWLVSAAWMFSDLQKNIDRTLDERLAASAKLVVSMLGASSLSAVDDGMRSSGILPDEDVNLMAGMACQVSSLKGEILVRSHNSPSERIGRMGEGYHTQVADGVEWRTFTLEADGVRISTADRIEQRARLKYAILEAAAVPVLVALIGGLVVLWICVGRGWAPSQGCPERSFQGMQNTWIHSTSTSFPWSCVRLLHRRMNCCFDSHAR